MRPHLVRPLQLVRSVLAEKVVSREPAAIGVQGRLAHEELSGAEVIELGVVGDLEQMKRGRVFQREAPGDAAAAGAKERDRQLLAASEHARDGRIERDKGGVAGDRGALLALPPEGLEPEEVRQGGAVKGRDPLELDPAQLALEPPHVATEPPVDALLDLVNLEPWRTAGLVHAHREPVGPGRCRQEARERRVGRNATHPQDVPRSRPANGAPHGRQSGRVAHEIDPRRVIAAQRDQRAPAPRERQRRNERPSTACAHQQRLSFAQESDCQQRKLGREQG